MNKLRVHWILLRPFATVGILPPMLLGFALAGANNFINFIVAFIGTTFILYATHYHNSYSDFVRGIDNELSGKSYTKASAILPLGLASVKEVVAAAVLLYVAGLAVFVWLSLHTTVLTMIPCIIGLFCGIAYNTFGKYIGLGEILLALSFGLACTLAGYIPVACRISLKPVLASFIPGVLWTLFYTVDQVQDVHDDIRAGIRNLAIALTGYNFPISRYIEFGFFLVISAHLYFILIHVLPASTFIALITSPLMFLSIMTCEAKNYRKGAVYLILTFGLYVLLMDLAVLEVVI